MKRYAFLMLVVLIMVVTPCMAVGLPWDKNTTTLHHFDLINIYTDYGDNSTLDQTPARWWDYGSPNYYNSGCKFGNCTRFFSSTESSYYLVNNEVGNPNFNVPIEYMFGKNNNWTVEGWVNLTVAPAANMNGTLVSWLGFGDKNKNTFNGTHIYINSARNLVVRTPSGITGTPYITSSTALTLGTWTNFAIVKNMTSMKMYLNGVQNGTASTANTYNWSPGYSESWLMADPNALVYNAPSIGASIDMQSYSVAPDAYLDEVRVSNSPRYPANYTVATTEFFNPLNKTTLFVDMAGTYNVGSVQTATLSISNISYTDIMRMNIGSIADPYDASIVSVMPYSSLPLGWSLLTNYTTPAEGTARLDFYTIGASPITSKTPIGTALVSIDYYGGLPLEIGSFKRPDFYNQIDNTTFYINGTTDTASDLIPNSFLRYQYQARPNIIDLSNDSMSGLLDFDIVPTTTVNVGEKFNVTMAASDLYNVLGTKSSVKYNASMFQISNIYGVEPYYDIDYTINNVNGYVNFTALYPQYGGITSQPFASCTLSDPTWCGFERYVNIEMYALYPASLPTAPAGSDSIYLDTGYYLAGSPFRNPEGYTYSDIYDFDIPYGSPSVTDDPLSTTVNIVNVNTRDNIPGAATVTSYARDSSPANPINFVGGTFRLTHRGGQFNLSVVADGFFTTTQTFTVGETGTTIDVLMVPLTGSNPNLNMLYPHETRFTVVDTHGAPIALLPTTMVMVNSTTDGTNWITTMFGVSPTATDIEGTEMEGLTDSFGYITFPVIGSGFYRITFTDASRGIGKTYYLHPSMSDYILVAPTTASAAIQSIGDFITGNLTVSPQGANVYLNMTYNDTGLLTTNVNYYIVYPNQTTFYTKNFAGTPALNQSVAFGYPVVNNRGDSYVWGYVATNTRWGMVNRSQGITLKGVDGILFNPFVYKDRW